MTTGFLKFTIAKKKLKHPVNFQNCQDYKGISISEYRTSSPSDYSTEDFTLF